MSIDRNSRIWWLLMPLGALLGLGAAVWMRTAGPQPVAIDFGRLTDIRGQPGQATDFAGRYLLVSFGYTSCPDICPLTLAAMHAALNELGSSSAALVPIFISVDPKRDTPDRLAVYIRAFDNRIRGFTGAANAIAATAATFHVEYQSQPATRDGSYAVDHTALLFLVDPKRRVVARIPENRPERDLSHQIVLEFNAARRRSTS